jgi:hypothetical protein
VTERVFDGVAWFATEYDPATTEFRSLTGRMRDLADGLSRRSSIGDGDISRLRRLTGRIETTVEDRLGPHFDTSPSIVADTRRLVDRIETLHAREDWDGAAATLSELAELHATVSTESYVSRVFPRDPVRGPLVRAIAGDGHADDLVAVAYHVGGDATVRIQQNPAAHPGTPPGGRDDVGRYRTLFGPLAAGPGGEAMGDAGAYLTVSGLTGGGATALSLRRYRDEAAAERAVESLLSGSVTESRTAELGGREWRRVFYRPTDNVVYADLTLSGSYLVVAGPSRQPWDDRPSDWLAPLELTWLWENADS